MGQRIIKFRAWNESQRKFTLPNGSISPGCFWDHGVLEPIQNNIFFQEFTGLLDKNGKEIYEGDIVEANNHCGIAEVKYGTPYAAAFTVDNMLVGVIDETDIRVIGNIYQDSHLLTESENPEILAK